MKYLLITVVILLGYGCNHFTNHDIIPKCKLVCKPDTDPACQTGGNPNECCEVVCQ